MNYQSHTHTHTTYAHMRMAMQASEHQHCMQRHYRLVARIMAITSRPAKESHTKAENISCIDSIERRLEWQAYLLLILHTRWTGGDSGKRRRMDEIVCCSQGKLVDKA